MIYFHTSYCFLLDARVENEIFLCLQTVSTSFTCRSLQYWLHQERNIAIVLRECSPPLTTDSICWGNSFLSYIVLWININLEWHQEHEERTQGEMEFRTLFAQTGNAHVDSVRPSVRPSVLSETKFNLHFFLPSLNLRNLRMSNNESHNLCPLSR